MDIRYRIIIGLGALFVIYLLQYTFFLAQSFLEDDETSLTYLQEQGTIVSVDQEGFLLKTFSEDLYVFKGSYVVEKGQFGEFLLVQLEESWYLQAFHAYPYHFLKYIISLVAVLIVVWIFLKEFTWTRKGFTYA